MDYRLKVRMAYISLAWLTVARRWTVTTLEAVHWHIKAALPYAQRRQAQPCVSELLQAMECLDRALAEIEAQKPWYTRLWNKMRRRYGR